MSTDAPAADLSAQALSELAVQLQVDLSAGQAEALLQYLQLLHRWNTTHNLTAVRTLAGMWRQHLADCLAVVRPLRTHLQAHPPNQPAAGRLLDVGSGGGLPGVVIAICQPALQVVCVDTVSKKAAFIRQVAGELRLANLSSVHARVESMRPGGFDVVTSRAFASLSDFVKFTRAQLAANGAWMAMKGQHPQAELAALPLDAQMFHVEHLTVPGLDAQRCLVWMRLATPDASA